MKAATEAWYQKNIEEVFKLIRSSPEGLGMDEVKKRQNEFGPNSLPEPKKKTLLLIFLSQFLSPLIYVLIAAGILSIVVGEVPDAIFIFAIIFINAVLGTWQEWKAETTAAALKSLIKIKSRVKRENRIHEVEAQKLVPGDIIVLESGMKVPADLRLFDVKELNIEEALLTGESAAVEKNTEPMKENDPPIGDRLNMAFAATTVMKGRGWGVVVEIAKNTEIGKIAESLTSSEVEKPPLIKRMDAFSKRISIAVVVICIVLALIGWWRGMAWMEILFFMVAVGVSAIPEGLPIALTVALSVGTRRMAKRNVIIRKLPAVEGLGSCTLIASDKTGTLTLDEQSVKKIIISEKEIYKVTGQGYNGEGEIQNDNEQKMNEPGDQLYLLIQAAILANEGILRKTEKGWEHSGDAVDVALRALAYKLGKKPDWFKEGVEIVDLVPYESEYKFSGVYFKKDGKLFFAMKGAAEVVNERLKPDQKDFSHKAAEQMAADGYRVLALASKPVNEVRDHDITGLELLGLFGLMDPLREEAIPAIEKCHKAGIEVVMITGDHPATALTIARELKIAEKEEQLITGQQITELTGNNKDDFPTAIKEKLVFARVSPLQKKEIIDGKKKEGHFVAVTGDGANDAPALKSAHIGIAMGSGTDLAKETASIIVADNNFASIAAGVEEGRFTYDNLRKIIYMLLSTGAAEILIVALPLFFGLPLPFIAVQLLWLNLVTNGIQDIALAFEKGDPAVMERPPRKPDERIFDRLMNQEILISAITMTIVTFAAWWLMIERLNYDEKHARTIIMMLMVLQQNFHVLNCRSETRLLFKMPMNNWILLIGVLFAQVIHISAAYIPGLRDVLQLQPVSLKEWLTLLPAAAFIFVVMEVFKWIRIRKSEV